MLNSRHDVAVDPTKSEDDAPRGASRFQRLPARDFTGRDGNNQRSLDAAADRMAKGEKVARAKLQRLHKSLKAAGV